MTRNSKDHIFIGQEESRHIRGPMKGDKGKSSAWEKPSPRGLFLDI